MEVSSEVKFALVAISENSLLCLIAMLYVCGQLVKVVLGLQFEQIVVLRKYFDSDFIPVLFIIQIQALLQSLLLYSNHPCPHF